MTVGVESTGGTVSVCIGRASLKNRMNKYKKEAMIFTLRCNVCIYSRLRHFGVRVVATAIVDRQKHRTCN